MEYSFQDSKEIELYNSSLDSFDFILKTLPMEILYNICQFLRKIDLSSLRLTCKYFHQVVTFPIWKQYCPFEEIESYFQRCQYLGWDSPFIYHVYFQSNSVVSDFSRLQFVRNLRSLNLTNCEFFDGNLMDSLPSSLTNLTFGNFNVKITTNHLNSLPPLLEKLDLTGCFYIVDEGLKNLPTTLTSLDLSFCLQITNQGLRYLPPNLKNLTLNASFILDTEGLKYLPTSLIRLELFNLSKLQDEDLLLPPCLEYLSFYDHPISALGISRLPPLLTSLALMNINPLPNEAFMSLPTRLKSLALSHRNSTLLSEFGPLPTSLTDLYLSKCNYVSDDYVQHFPSGLKKLILEGSELTDNGLAQLPTSLTKLTLLDCNQITDEGLEIVSSKLLNLKEIHVKQCSKLTNIGLKKISHLIKKN